MVTEKRVQCLFLCLLVLAVNFVTMPRDSYTGDPAAMQMGTQSLLRGGLFEVTPALATTSIRGKFFVQNSRNGKYYSKYGVFNSLMFVPPFWAEKALSKIPVPGPGATGRKSDRTTFYLNLYNIFLVLIATAYLFSIAALYSNRGWVRLTYVLTALYSTYLWNFMRAQSADLFQVVFFAGLFYHLMAYRRALIPVGKNSKFPRTQLIAAIFYLSCLCFCKLSHVLLIPPTLIWFLAANYVPPKNKNRLMVAHMIGQLKLHLRDFTFFAFLPIIGIGLSLLFLNYYQFGSPLDAGYTQWVQYTDSFAGDIFEGLYGFFFLANRSIFVHFPILFFALFGIRQFYKKYSLEALWIGAVFMIFLLTISKLPFWAGEACYGPRLLLFMLPVASLPFIETLHGLQDHWKKTSSKVAGAFIGLLLLASFQLQMNINALPFFVYYSMESAVTGAADPVNQNILDQRFFKGRNYGVLNAEFLSYKKSGVYPPFDYAKTLLQPSRFTEMKNHVDSMLTSNYYWFN